MARATRDDGRPSGLLRVDPRRLAKLIYHHPDGIVVVDQDGRIRFANPAAERLFNRRDLVGSPFGSPLKTAERMVLDIPRRSEPAVSVELEVVEIRWEGADAQLVSLRDVTEREHLEEQLRQAQKMEAVGHLAAGIAHDFNNVLTGITGAASLLRTSLAAEGVETEDVELILSLADRAAERVEQLLVFSREQTVNRVPQPLDGIIEDAIEMIDAVISDGVEIRQGGQIGDAVVLADRNQLQQVLLNLAINARDAMSGKGTLTISTALRRVDAEAVERHPELDPGAHAVISVSDTGRGIPEEVLDNIFDPFFSTKGRAEGTGLGLSTAYGIVRQHDGTITVESEPDEGTVFHLWLPIAAESDETVAVEGGEPSAAGAPSASAAAPEAGNTTLLVVDDEAMVAEVLRRTLEAKGYDVLVAAGAEQARQLFERHREAIEVLVSDVMMPGCGGPELFEELSRDRPDLRALFLSGYSDGQIDELPHGAAFLPKPFEPAQLADKIDEILKAGA